MQQYLTIALTRNEVDFEPLRSITRQGGSWCDNRTLIDQYLLERWAFDTIGEILVCGIKSFL